MKIHIVEDDPSVNEALRFLLQALGYTVSSHADAVSFFDAAPPNADEVVIVDLGLPGIDGASVIRWTTRLSPQPRVIAISGQSQRLIDQATKGIAGVSILRKPLNGDILLPLLA